MSKKIDTSTPEGFNEALSQLDLTVPQASLVLGVSVNTLKNWIKQERPVHPTAAMMLDWLLTNWRPDDWHMTGDDMRLARESMGMTQDELGKNLDLDADTIAKFESDHSGPPHFVARAIRWLDQSAPRIVNGSIGPERRSR